MMLMVRAFFHDVLFARWFVLTQVIVLTRVVVYVGIGAMARVFMPAMFEALGWGV
jgi:hypothetical protein